MIAYVSLHACCPSQITHFKSSFESSNSGVKMPYPGSFPRLFFFCLFVFVFLNKLRLGTRWNNISVFIITVALGVAVLLPPLSPSAVVFIDRSSESPLLQLSRFCGYLKRCVQFLSISRHHWARLKNLFGFPSHMKKIFKAANQNKNKFCLLFSSITESHRSHWSVMKTTDWSKKINECSVFHSVLGLYTNDFLDLLLLYFL